MPGRTPAAMGGGVHEHPDVGQRLDRSHHNRTRRPTRSRQAGTPPWIASTLELQRLAGNAAVTDLLARTSGGAAGRAVTGPAATVQRDVTLRPPTVPADLVWPDVKRHTGRTTMVRTTTIKAYAVDEEGEAIRPRILYTRDVDVDVPGDVTVGVGIASSAYLPMGAPLPASPAEAVARTGVWSTSRYVFSVEGGDFEPVSGGGGGQRIAASSISSAATLTLPRYAQLPLTLPEQEDEILRHLATLKRRVPDQKDSGGAWLDAGVAIATDLMPVIGELKDLYRAITGRDPDTGGKLAWWERLLAGVMALPFVGKFLKGVKSGLSAFGGLAKRLLGPLFAKVSRPTSKRRPWSGRGSAGPKTSWEKGLSPETQAWLETNPKQRKMWNEMDPRVRRILTRCASPCIPENATPQQAAKIHDMVRRLKPTVADELLMREYFYARRMYLDHAITQIGGAANLNHLRAGLRRAASERVAASVPLDVRQLPPPGHGRPAPRGTWGEARSRAYGHSYAEHGPQHPPNEMRDRAMAVKRKGDRAPQPDGQFYDESLIVEAERRAPATPGAHEVDMRRPAGRVFETDGTVTSDVTWVRVIRADDGSVVTSYPIKR